MAVQIQIRRGTAAAWTAANPTLAAGEFAVETDTDKYKFGDGSTAWTSLGYSSLPSTAISNTVVDPKGDIIAATADNTVAKLTVGSNGQVLTAASGQSTGLQWTTISSDSISDADSDTKIQVEEGSDEDIIRFDTAGTERMSIGATGTVTIVGDLTVNGTTTTINSTTLSVDDKNIELGSVASPSDTTADGGGITLKGASDKTITWTNSTDTWDFNQSVNVASGTDFKVNGVSTLSATTLGAAVVSSSLTSVGTLSALTVTGDITAGGINAPVHSINTQTGTSYTLAIGDANGLVDTDNGSANTVTVPPNSSVAFPVGTQVLVVQQGGGQTTIVAGSGVSLRAKDGLKLAGGAYAGATLIKRATNDWYVIGSLEA